MAKVELIGLYGLEQSVMGSKFPMSTEIESLTDDITDTVNKLAASPIGSGHDNFLNGITVIFDLTFSNKAWVEAERYTFLNFISSQSTMHRISQFDLRKSCNGYVTETIVNECEKLLYAYHKDPSLQNYLTLLYNIPSGFELTARMITNYRCLKTIYKQRKNHKLPDWQVFCKWCETLPHFKSWFLGE